MACLFKLTDCLKAHCLGGRICHPRLVVSGEAFIRPGDFLKLQETLTDSSGERYVRHLLAGQLPPADDKFTDLEAQFREFPQRETGRGCHPW